jgi:hypothetical protein
MEQFDNNDFHNLFLSSNIVNVIKSKWPEHIRYTVETTKT